MFLAIYQVMSVRSAPSVVLALSLALVVALPALSTTDDPTNNLSAGNPAVAVLGSPSLDLGVLRAALDAGQLIVRLADGEHTLALAPNDDLLAADAPVLVDGLPAARPDIQLYAGLLDDDPRLPARMSVTPDGVQGVIRTLFGAYEIATHDGNVRLTPVGAGPDQRIDYEPHELEALADSDPDTTDLLADLSAKQGPTGCLGAAPEANPTMVDFVQGDSDPLTLQVVVVGDQPYGTRYGASWAAKQLQVLNDMDAVYEANFNINLQVVAQLLDSAGTTYTSNDPSVLLNQLRSTWISNPLPRDLVHLFSNREFTGDVVGQAYCIGGAHSVLTHYTVTQTLGFVEFWQGAISVHEVGHMMSAHHHYFNCVEALTSPGLVDTCTVMAPAINVMDNSLVFSTLSKTTIRSYGEDVL